MRRHLGIDFEVWKAQDIWYWLVARPGLNRGATGAAATEVSAMRDAHWSIEEMTASPKEMTALREDMTARPPESLPAGSGEKRQSIFRRPAAITENAECWETMLANLQQYLTCLECSAI